MLVDRLCEHLLTGPDFQKYIRRAKEEYGVKYIRGKVAEIKIDEDENPILFYEDLDTFEVKSKNGLTYIYGKDDATLISYGSHRNNVRFFGKLNL